MTLSPGGKAGKGHPGQGVGEQTMASSERASASCGSTAHTVMLRLIAPRRGFT